MTINWYKPSQCILFLVTVSSLFVFVGCLACGFLLHFAPEEPSEEVNGGIYTTVPTIALLCAAILTVVALVLGCTGACKDSKLILVVFSVFAFAVVGVTLASGAAVFAFTMNGQIRDKLSEVMESDLKTYSANNTEGGNLFDTIQTDYKCCGVDDYGDWLNKNTTWRDELPKDSEAIAPSFCCMTNSSEPGCNYEEKNLYPKGCLDVLLDRMKTVVYIVFGVAVILGLLQAVTALCACYGATLIQRYQSYDIL